MTIDLGELKLTTTVKQVKEKVSEQSDMAEHTQILHLDNDKRTSSTDELEALEDQKRRLDSGAGGGSNDKLKLHEIEVSISALHSDTTDLELTNDMELKQVKCFAQSTDQLQLSVTVDETRPAPPRPPRPPRPARPAPPRPDLHVKILTNGDAGAAPLTSMLSECSMTELCFS
jgi:hypothetical protein